MDLRLFLEIAGFVVVVGGILFSAGNQRGRSESIEENLNIKIDQHIADDLRIETSIKNQVGKLWEWKDLHEKEAGNNRLEIQKQLGRTEAAIAIHDSQFSQLINSIAKMERSIGDKIDKLETKIEQFNKN